MSVHDLYVAAAYAAAAGGIAALVGWVVADHAARRRELAQLDAEGIRRRSADRAS